MERALPYVRAGLGSKKKPFLLNMDWVESLRTSLAH
jgi:hypothetical protein